MVITLFPVPSLGISSTLGWMAQDPTSHKSTLVQVMTWCRQASNKPLPETMSIKVHDAMWRH